MKAMAIICNTTIGLMDTEYIEAFLIRMTAHTCFMIQIISGAIHNATMVVLNFATSVKHWNNLVSLTTL